MYDLQIVDVSKELIESSCDRLKPIAFTEDFENDYVIDTMNLGTSLFELYLLMQQMTS